LVANLVEDLTQRLLPLLINESNIEIAALASILIRQGRILGMLPKRFKYPDTLTSVIVAEPPHIRESSFHLDSAQGKWEGLRLEAVQNRRGFRTIMLNCLACFQGTGKIPYAIDLAKIPKEAIYGDETLLELPAPLKAHVVNLKPNRLAHRTRPLIKNVNDFYSLAYDLLGDSLDKNGLVANLKDLLERLEAAAVWPEGDFGKKKLRTEVVEFRQTALKELLDQIKPLREIDLDPSGEIAVDCLGRIDLNLLEQSERFLNRAKEFVEAAEQKVEIQSRSIQGISIDEDVKAIGQKFKMIASDMQEIVGNEVES